MSNVRKLQLTALAVALTLSALTSVDASAAKLQAAPAKRANVVSVVKAKIANSFATIRETLMGVDDGWPAPGARVASSRK